MAYSVENWRSVLEIDLAVVQSFGAFSPGGRFLAAADTNTIEVREARRGGIVATVQMLAVTSLAVSADGDLLVAADDEGNINAWSLSPNAPLWSDKLVMPPPAYAEIVYDVQFATTGGLAVASKPAGVNNTLVGIWPVQGTMRQRPGPLWQSVMLNSDYHSFSPSPDATRILLITDEGYWLIHANNERSFIDGFFAGGENAVAAFSPDGRLAAAIEPEGGWIYRVGEHEVVEIVDIGMLDEPTDVSWSPNGEALLVTTEDGLSLCTRTGDEHEFTYQGVLADLPGFEAAAFVDADTIVAKRADSLMLYTIEGNGHP
ncbi:MAG: WD40 repeat domain-containing protein [Chloroflexota bacterium]